MAMTIAIGVIALVTGNNTLYLVESLLLSALIFSGVVSDRDLSSIRVEIEREPATARARSRDRIRVRNTRRLPVFAVQIGEWRGGKFEPLAFLPRIAGRTTLLLRSSQAFGERGERRWEGVAVATAAPFGFARKIRIDRNARGTRLIWPARWAQGPPGGAQPPGERPGGRALRAASTHYSDSEVRPLPSGEEDPRGVVWTLSARGGPWVARKRAADETEPDVVFFHLCAGEDPREFERRIEKAAQPFHDPGSADPRSGKLTWVEPDKSKRIIRGRRRALDALARARWPGEGGLGG